MNKAISYLQIFIKFLKIVLPCRYNITLIFSRITVILAECFTIRDISLFYSILLTYMQFVFYFTPTPQFLRCSNFHFTEESKNAFIILN